MAFRAIAFALLLSSLLMGCGTVANLATPGPEGGKVPFGGVSHDMASIKKASDGEPISATHQDQESAHYSHTAFLVLCAADLPLSLIGDVVAWPYTCAYTFINEPVPVPPVTYAPAESAQIQIPPQLPMVPPPPRIPPVDPMTPPVDPLADSAEVVPAVTLPSPKPERLP
jgi:uncharacterized protein YceK